MTFLDSRGEASPGSLPFRNLAGAKDAAERFFLLHARAASRTNPDAEGKPIPHRIREARPQIKKDAAKRVFTFLVKAYHPDSHPTATPEEINRLTALFLETKAAYDSNNYDALDRMLSRFYSGAEPLPPGFVLRPTGAEPPPKAKKPEPLKKAEEKPSRVGPIRLPPRIREKPDVLAALGEALREPGKYPSPNSREAARKIFLRLFEATPSTLEEWAYAHLYAKAAFVVLPQKFVKDRDRDYANDLIQTVALESLAAAKGEYQGVTIERLREFVNVARRALEPEGEAEGAKEEAKAEEAVAPEVDLEAPDPSAAAVETSLLHDLARSGPRGRLEATVLYLHLGHPVFPQQEARFLGSVPRRDLANFHSTKSGREPCPTCASISKKVMGVVDQAQTIAIADLFLVKFYAEVKRRAAMSSK
jgi:hypothetical protein